MVTWTELAGALAHTGAPTLGSALGGPMGSVIGSLVGATIAHALGVQETPEAVFRAITQDPASAEKLAIIEKQHAAELNLFMEQMRLVSKTAQIELASQDRFIKWARPANIWTCAFATIGYSCVIIIASLHSIWILDTRVLVALINAAPYIGILLAPSGAVAGLTAWGRTKEKLGYADMGLEGFLQKSALQSSFAGSSSFFSPYSQKSTSKI